MYYISRFSFLVAFTFLTSIAQATVVFTPPNLNAATARTVVVIHGCLQSADSMVAGTGWNHIAEENNLVIIYPQVPAGSNPLSCWSWYVPDNQRADSGQLKTVMDEINSVRQSLKIQSSEIYLAGLSSGAATVAGLMACFPNTFKSGAIHSGPSYGLAKTLQEAEKVLKDGPQKISPADAKEKESAPPCQPAQFAGTVLVIQGKQDNVVNPKNALRTVSEFAPHANVLSTRDLKAGGVQYTVTDYGSAQSVKARLVMVEDLGHAWSGSPKRESIMQAFLPFFSEIGPNATQLMWEFFQQGSRRPNNVSPEKKASPKVKK